jgi:hypothetical protein
MAGSAGRRSYDQSVRHPSGDENLSCCHAGSGIRGIRCCTGARHERFEALFQGPTRNHDSSTATGAAQADIGSNAHYRPVCGPARMRLFQPDHIIDRDVQHRHCSCSVCIEPDYSTGCAHCSNTGRLTATLLFQIVTICDDLAHHRSREGKIRRCGYSVGSA